MTTVTYPARTGLGASNYLGEYTYATLPSASAYANKQLLATDLGASGTMLRSNGTRWCVANGTGMLKRLGAAVTGVGSSETIVLQSLIPTGAWQAQDTIRFWTSLAKSGSTDAGSIVCRVGTAGTTADTVITGLNGTILAAANRTGSFIFDVKLLTATSAKKMSTGANGYGGVANTADYAATTISDATANPLYFSVSILSQGSTDTMAISDGQIQLITP